MWAPYLKWNFSFPAVICSCRSHPPSEITWNITNPSPFIQQPHHFWIVLSGIILSLSLCHFSIDSLLYSKYIILASHISAFLLTLTISKALLPFAQLAFQSSPSGPWLFSPLWHVLHGWLFLKSHQWQTVMIQIKYSLLSGNVKDLQHSLWISCKVFDFSKPRFISNSAWSSLSRQVLLSHLLIPHPLGSPPSQSFLIRANAASRAHGELTMLIWPVQNLAALKEIHTLSRPRKE